VPDPIHVLKSVFVPKEAIRVRSVRSSGPGGQNVNKVASKVELHIDLEGIRGLSPEQRVRLERIVSSRTDSVGRLLVTSQRTRDQHLNLRDAREKARRLLASCLQEPRKRRPTRPHAGARERRLEEKRSLGAKKATRRAATEE
jgi:ribosome-associated protein